MTSLRKGARFRAAIGLIAAYAIALQTLFAAFAAVPASAAGLDFGSVICFGSGNAAAPDRSDPNAPAPASGKYHCVLCGSVLAGAAILPEPVAAPCRQAVQVESRAGRDTSVPVPIHAARTGPARAPPLTV